MIRKTSRRDPVLVVAAHPDDEVLGCGGTIARLAQEDFEVYIAILGEGITSRFVSSEQADPSLVAKLHSNSHEAAKIVGAKDLFMFSLPDNRFDTVAILDVVKIIESLIDQLQPRAIYTQHGGDLNIDHYVTYRATMTAARPLPGSPVKSVYAYEVASSTEWAFQKFSPPFCPNVFVDIGATLDIKLRAMQSYESESRTFPHPRSPQALTAIAQRWGSVVGLPAAEAFEVVYDVR
ncbi:MAG: PIG-L family deacetylase [Chloroflexi bacterium]|nr:PIG-L family deacetylase [Chloroflexota bacterium]